MRALVSTDTPVLETWGGKVCYSDFFKGGLSCEALRQALGGTQNRPWTQRVKALDWL